MPGVPATLPTSATTRLSALRLALPAVLAALAFRAVCYAAMIAAALWNEARPAPVLPDLVLSHVPFVPWVARLNYLAWLALYLPVAAALLWLSPRAFVRYTVSGGIVSLLRGLTIAVTGLGAPPPHVGGAGIAGHSFGDAFVALLSPWQVFAHDAMAVYLTQDLFFSGHTATTFLLLLYAWRFPRLRALALVAHALVVATVFLSHLHYTIDVLGAWAFTFAVFALREGWPARERA